jgi:hypothetical protein
MTDYASQNPIKIWSQIHEFRALHNHLDMLIEKCPVTPHATFTAGRNLYTPRNKFGPLAQSTVTWKSYRQTIMMKSQLR